MARFPPQFLRVNQRRDILLARIDDYEDGALEPYAEFSICLAFFDEEGDFPSDSLKELTSMISKKWDTRRTLTLYSLAIVLVKSYQYARTTTLATRHRHSSQLSIPSLSGRYSYERRVGLRQETLAMTFPDQQTIYSQVLAVYNCMGNAQLCPSTCAQQSTRGSLPTPTRLTFSRCARAGS